MVSPLNRGSREVQETIERTPRTSAQRANMKGFIRGDFRKNGNTPSPWERQGEFGIPPGLNHFRPSCANDIVRPDPEAPEIAAPQYQATDGVQTPPAFHGLGGSAGDQRAKIRSRPPSAGAFGSSVALKRKRRRSEPPRRRFDLFFLRRPGSAIFWARPCLQSI